MGNQYSISSPQGGIKALDKANELNFVGGISPKLCPVEWATQERKTGAWDTHIQGLIPEHPGLFAHENPVCLFQPLDPEPGA